MCLVTCHVAKLGTNCTEFTTLSERGSSGPVIECKTTRAYKYFELNQEKFFSGLHCFAQIFMSDWFCRDCVYCIVKLSVIEIAAAYRLVLALASPMSGQ